VREREREREREGKRRREEREGKRAEWRVVSRAVATGRVSVLIRRRLKHTEKEQHERDVPWYLCDEC
jgi:hypothetical protein